MKRIDQASSGFKSRAEAMDTTTPDGRMIIMEEYQPFAGEIASLIRKQQPTINQATRYSPAAPVRKRSSIRVW